MILEKILKKTEEYLTIPSVVGFENPFIDHLAKDFDLPNYKIKKQNKLLIITKKNSKSSKILTAHIDRVGIVVNKDGKYEYAPFSVKTQNGDKFNISKKMFNKLGKRFVGESVFAYDLSGKILAEGKVTNFSNNIQNHNIFFTIEGMKNLPPKTPIAYKSKLNKEKGISSQLDNVIVIAIIRQLVDDGFDGIIIFSIEEESGKSWKYIADYLDSMNNQSQEIITLDTTPHDDDEAIKKGLVGLRNKDENAKFNKNIVSKLKKICEEQKIKYEMKDEIVFGDHLGKTELGRIIQHTKGKFNGATVQLPTINYHTNYEKTSELAIKNYYAVLKKLLI